MKGLTWSSGRLVSGGRRRYLSVLNPMLMACLTVLQVPGDIHVGILFNLAKPLKATKEDLPEFWRGLD